MSNTQEIVQRLEREIADRSAAVEEVDAFKNQLARAIKAFMAANEAVRGLNDHDSDIDTKIAAAIDEHLRAIDTVPLRHRRWIRRGASRKGVLDRCMAMEASFICEEHRLAAGLKSSTDK